MFSLPSNAAGVTAFVAPDSSFDALEGFLADAENVKIAAYTFTSQDIADLLDGSATVMVDASPAGGFPVQGKAIFCLLSRKGVSVYLYDGPLRFMHAKYIIDGDKALIASENMGDDGFPASPNHGNRGWGVIVEDEDIARQLNAVFEEDLRNSKPFVCDGNYNMIEEEKSSIYTPQFMPQRFENQSVALITAPDALPSVLELINSANARLLIEQFYIHRYFDRKSKAENPLLETLISAARRGVNISVLLDSYSYNIESDDPSSNLYTNEYLDSVANDEKLPLDSRLIDLDNGLLKLHNKGMIADDAVLVSSINWNRNSPTSNREIGIVVKGAAAGYFASVFDYDFHSENRITGFAASKSVTGIGMVVLIAAVLVWIRKRGTLHNKSGKT